MLSVYLKQKNENEQKKRIKEAIPMGIGARSAFDYQCRLFSFKGIIEGNLKCQ